MTTFMFAYRMPSDYTPGGAETVAAWNAWFQGMGADVADRGNPIFRSATVGQIGAGTVLGGYSMIVADDLDAALALAEQCPALSVGGGIEVGVITPLDR